MNLAPVLRQRFLDANGLPLNGGNLYSYAAGTTTPLVTYSNATGTSNTNPVVLDSSGYADVWLDPTLAYKLVLKDSGGATLWTVDNVTFAVGISAWNANAIYQTGQMVTDSSGAGLMYVSLIDNNQNQPLTNVSAWRMFQGKIRTVSANTTLAVTDELVRSNSTSGALTMTLPACSTTPVGKRIVIKDVGTGGNTTSVKGSGTDLVDGNNTYSNSLTRYSILSVENNGTSWDVLILSAGAGTVESVSTVTTSTSLTVADGLVRSNSTSGNLTQTLPACSTTPVGKRITIKDVGTSTNTTTVKGSGTDLVDGNNTYATALIKNQSATFENNGTSWDAIGIPADNSIVAQKIPSGSIANIKLAAVNLVSASIDNTFASGARTIQALSQLTTVGRPVRVVFQPDSNATDAGYFAAQAGSTVSTFKIARDSTVIVTISGGSGSDPHVPCRSLELLDTPGAGSYTYSLQADSDAGVIVSHVKMIAYEI